MHSHDIDYLGESRLTTAMVEQLVENSRTVRGKLLITLAAQSGLRRAELAQLTWKPFLPHINDGMYLIEVEPRITKETIGHLAGVGPDSAELVRLWFREQQRKGVAIDERYPLISDSYDPRKFLEPNTITQEFGRQLDKLDLRGTGEGEGYGIRYDRCFHQLRHYFKSQMINNGAPELVAKILGGWTVTTYDDHLTDEQLFDWYARTYPQVRVKRDQETVLRDVESILKRDGVELGPKARLKLMNILRGQFPVSESHRGECREAAEATRGSLKVTKRVTKGIF